VVGKKIPLEDLILICGHVNLGHYHKDISKVFHFLVCEVTLGSAALFPEGFDFADSLLLEQNEANDPFHYNAFVKSYDQYQVRYECSFVVAEEADFKPATISCSLCGMNAAKVYCRTESKHFCQKCSELLHVPPPPLEVQRKMKEVPPQHQLEEINRTNSLSLCEHHNLRF
jgi:hypothetical protein